MKITFQKDKNNRLSLRCEREDGTSTYTILKSPASVYHDLAHLAVERTLGFRKAFFGLLAQGFDIPDFEAKREERPAELLPANLPLEALQTEHIVNLLITEHFNSGKMSDFLSILNQSLIAAGLALPDELNEDTLAIIRDDFAELQEQWSTLPVEHSISYSFPWD